MTPRRWYCASMTPEQSIWHGVADDQTDVAQVIRYGRHWSVFIVGSDGRHGQIVPCGTLKRGKAMAEGREAP